MEAVKEHIHASVSTAIGPCAIRFDTRQQCMIIRVDAFPRIIVYVQPDRWVGGWFEFNTCDLKE